MAEFQGNNRFFVNHAMSDSLHAVVKTWRISNRTWNIALKENCYIQLPFLSSAPGNDNIAFNFIIKPVNQEDNIQRLECSLTHDTLIQCNDFECKILFHLWDGKERHLDAGNTNTSVSEFSGKDIDVNKGYPLWEIKYDTSNLASYIRDGKNFIHLRFYIEFKKEIDVIQTQASRLIDNFTRFNKYTDVDIVCNDTIFKTNKRLLASQSEVFKQMLQQPLSEHLSNIITIKDTNSSALNQLIFFLSSAKISNTITTEGLIDLTYIADKYLISTLKKECLMKLESYFDTENIIDILMLSEHCQLGERFDKRVLKYMKSNVHNVINKESWSDLQRNHPNKVNQFILYSLGRNNVKEKNGKKNVNLKDQEIMAQDAQTV